MKQILRILSIVLLVLGIVAFLLAGLSRAVLFGTNDASLDFYSLWAAVQKLSVIIGAVLSALAAVCFLIKSLL